MILHSQVALKIHVSQPLWPSVSKLWLSSSLTVMGVNDCLLWFHQQSWSRGSKLECRQRWNKYIYSGPVCWGWGLHESDLFQHIRQILDKYEIWRFWRPGWQCELLVMSLESFLSSFWGVAAATGEGPRHEMVHLVRSGVWRGGACQEALTSTSMPGTKSFGKPLHYSNMGV